MERAKPSGLLASCALIYDLGYRPKILLCRFRALSKSLEFGHSLGRLAQVATATKRSAISQGTRAVMNSLAGAR